MTRLSKSLHHYRRKSSKVEIEKQQGGATATRPVRGRCIVCCGNCDQHSKTPHAKCVSRHRRKVADFCVACGVYVCKLCWVSFHEDEVPALPPCLQKKLGLSSPRALRFDTVLPVAKSPARVVPRRPRIKECSPSRAGSTAKAIGERIQRRLAGDPATSPVRAWCPTRSNAESLPSRAASAAKIIGGKLLLRAANKPTRLMTESPKDTMPESPLRGVRQIKERVVKRRGPGLLAVNRPGGRGRKRKGEEKRTATSVMAAVSRGRRGAAAKRKKSEPSARATKKHKKSDGGEGPACC